MYFFFFYPVGTAPPNDRPAPGALLLLVILAAVFGVRFLDPGLYLQLVHSSFRADHPTLPSAVLSLFLHGGWVHLLSNALYLFIFGRQLEGRHGFLTLATIFLVGGVSGCYVQAWLTPADAWNRGSAVIGASGAIAAVLGASMFRFHFTRVRVLWVVFAFLGGLTKGGVAHVNTVIAAAAWFVFQVVYGLVAWGNGGASTAYAAHGGGFLAGVLLALAFGFPRKARQELHKDKGKRYFEKGDWYAAAGELTAHLKLVPEDDEVRSMRARCYVVLGRSAEAASEYLAAFRVARRRRDFDAVARLYKEMRRYGIGTSLNDRMLMRLAFDLQKAERWEAAAETYLEICNRFPHGPKAELALIRRSELFWERLGDVPEAQAGYRRLLAEFPGSEWRDLAEARLRSMERLSGSGITRPVMTPPGSPHPPRPASAPGAKASGSAGP